MVATQDRPFRPRPSAAVWVTAAIAALILFVVLWVAVRALIARDQLLGAVPLAHSIASTALAAQGANINDDVKELQDRASTAASLTSDPVWRVAEFVPVLGNNLTAFREAASMIHTVADDALPPLADLADTFTVASLAPEAGTFDLQIFVDAAPKLGEARTALETADSLAAEINTRNTVPQIGRAVDQMVDLVNDAKAIVGGLDTAASLLPPMLGAEGPRNYLLLSLNNSELRAGGGLPNAIAVVTADGGTVSLSTQSTSTAIGEFSDPVLPLTGGEETLFGDSLGTSMNGVTYTPDFARSGALAQAMWEDRTGLRVDGVIAVDPIAIGYLLRATGPVDGGSGVTLTAESAADVMLNGVYSMFDETSQQDAFLAGVTAQMFAAVTHGEVNSRTLFSALAKSANEGRVHLWSSNEAEQAQIVGMPIAGAVPESTDSRSAFGVYFNDSTGANMGYYLRGAIRIASAICRADARPSFDVTVRLNSAAPVDAATSLSSHVTGGGVNGVEAGTVRTNVFVYAPEGAVPYSVTIDGVEYGFVDADLDGHSVAGVTVSVLPGQKSNVSFKFVGIEGNPTAVSLSHTAMASDVSTSLDNYLDCGTVPAAPSGEESGALPAPFAPGPAA